MPAGVEPRVTASANPVVAKRHGLTKWDRQRGQYVAPDPEESVDDLPVEEEAALDYDVMTVPQLQAELDARKKAYEEAGDTEGAEAVSYAKKDKRDDLIVLLREDDEAVAEPAEGD